MALIGKMRLLHSATLKSANDTKPIKGIKQLKKALLAPYVNPNFSEYNLVKVARCTSRQSKSNPIKLNFNCTQSNSIHGLSSIEFGNRTKSNSLKRKKNQSNPNERSIFELVICVKQALKIQILEARVTWARSVAYMFFLNEEILQKWLQMCCGL